MFRAAHTEIGDGGATEEMLSGPAFEWLRDLTNSANRLDIERTQNIEKTREVVSR